ncbi:MAG: chloride channel protein [Sulfuricella sp.]|jgi:H+/Cl- antiporter ClcA|nr:chloride channel protein [Sulfuricella sp.]
MSSPHQILPAIRSAKLVDLDAWRGRLVVWTAAATAGLVIVLFAWATDYAIARFFSWQKANAWLPLILTPVGGMLIVWLTNRWFVGVGGSGIPQTIAALQEGGKDSPHTAFVSLRLAFGKVVLGVGALAAGFSAGKEGPSVQVGASVMHAFRHFLPAGFSVHPKHLILAGGAAGISAAFNTPLAGIVFAIEELGRSFEQKTNGVVITAIILAGVVSISLQGNYTYFGHFAVGRINTDIVMQVIVCALVCGMAGGIFSRTLIESSGKIKGKTGEFRRLHPLWWAGFCGLMVALLGAISGGSAHGSGYLFTREMLDGSFSEISWQYAPIKYLATIFTYLSGVPGGIFAPSLSIGAGIGNDLLPLFSPQHAGTAIVALCMAGFLSAVTQAPITSFIIVMEMIDGHEMVISLMAVAMISAIVSRIFSPPLYATIADMQMPRVSGDPATNN